MADVVAGTNEGDGPDGGDHTRDAAGASTNESGIRQQQDDARGDHKRLGGLLVALERALAHHALDFFFLALTGLKGSPAAHEKKRQHPDRQSPRPSHRCASANGPERTNREERHEDGERDRHVNDERMQG